MTSADLLLLNQLDRVPEADWDALEARLREIEPEAPILRAVHGDVDPELLFPPDPRELRARRRAAAASASPHTHERFVAEEIAVPAGTQPDALRAQLAALGALRVKGFVETSEGVRAVQGVGSRIDIEPPQVQPPAELVGHLVVIRRA